MKAKTIITIFLLSSILIKSVHAQKIDKYCKVIFNYKGFNNKPKISVDLGGTDSLFSFKDTSIIVALKRTEEFSSEVDALNYMALLGWEWVGKSMDGYYHPFIFRRSFDPSELKNP